jgi:NADH:ubiquinone oxidoreductase subunit 3 (subunit A)
MTYARRWHHLERERHLEQEQETGGAFNLAWYVVIPLVVLFGIAMRFLFVWVQ